MHDANTNVLVHVPPMTDSRAAAISYLRAVLDETQLTPTGLAKLAGISSTTITRPLHDPDHKFTLSATTLEKIARATGVNFSSFFDAESHIERSTRIFYEETPFSQSASAPAEYVMVSGFVEAGVWRDPNFRNPYEFPLDIVPVNGNPKDYFGLVVKDASINKLADVNDVLYGIFIRAKDRTPVAGTLLIVERSLNGLVEITARRLRGTWGAWELHYASNDARYNEIISTPKLDGSGEFKIVGQVAHILREPDERD